jgi:hypothetical protein
LEIVLLVIVFSVGTLLGYICRVFLVRKMGYTGTILVTEAEDKKIFTLELNDDPDNLQDEDEVIFKVKTASQEKHSL